MGIYSCKGCVPPKRHPGCHACCSAYLAEKAKHDELTAAINERKGLEYGLDHRCTRGIYRRKKG